MGVDDLETTRWSKFVTVFRHHRLISCRYMSPTVAYKITHIKIRVVYMYWSQKIRGGVEYRSNCPNMEANRSETFQIMENSHDIMKLLEGILDGAYERVWNRNLGKENRGSDNEKVFGILLYTHTHIHLKTRIHNKN